MKEIWKLEADAIVWPVQPRQTHRDNYEMSGLGCDCIVDYGVDDAGRLLLQCDCYFPTLRTIPNNTHATLEVQVPQTQLLTFLHNGQAVAEYPQRFVLDGTWAVESHTDVGVQIRRQFLPASDGLCTLQCLWLTALQDVTLAVAQPKETVLRYTLGTKGVYVSRVSHDAPAHIVLQAGQAVRMTVCISAQIAGKPQPMPRSAEERLARYCRIRQLCENSIVVSTGIASVDAMVRFAKLRAGESIFQTLTGKLHSPGGRTYYAAVWCNDQVEYAGPHFAMTGDSVAIEASLNAYRAYIPYMAENFAPLPSSVIAEGLDIWNGAGDRGDAAMYLYGASLFALYLGDRAVAQELYPAICWCAEYCYRHTGAEGVVLSDTDELEGRIPTDGYANLSTSALCYGGLMAAAKLADSLKDPETAAQYRQRANKLRLAIEEYYGANLHGFETYRYSKGFDTLRSWICLPLCMGIEDRLEGTMDAMLSQYLWTEEGMLSCELSQDNRDSTIWDRSTLYGLKTAFASGYGDRVLQPFVTYCHKRLLCDRVPYAVEAYPEGAKRQLSAESALLVRIVTEGMLSLQPEGLTSFSFVPRLPREMPHLHIRSLYLCGHCWEIRVEKDGWQALRDGNPVAQGVTDGKRVTIS